MKVDISYNGKIIVTDIALADNFWTRLSGYMFRTNPHVSGILFEPAKVIPPELKAGDYLKISKNLA